MKNLNTAPAGDTAVSTFNFRGFDLRCVEIDGQPWFVAADACRHVGLSNTTMATQSLNEDEVRLKRIEGMRGSAPRIISESGLYKIIMRSDKPQAREFQDWVTREVLPAIRKDGGYIEGEEKVRTGEMSEDELVLKAMEVMKTKIDRLAAERDAYHSELYHVTVAEYAALNHVYFTQQQKTKLSLRARKLTLDAGEEVVKSPRVVNVKGQMIDTAVNVYKRDTLDRAAKELKLFPEAHGQMRPLTAA